MSKYLRLFVIFGLMFVMCSASEAVGVAHTASGTYTWNATTGVITQNWTSSDFTCDGPSLGAYTNTGVTVTATTITWANDNMTWTRASGTAGNIVGTWTYTDSTTGNSYTFTFNANGMISATGVIVQCGGGGGGSQNPSVYSQHWPNGYYIHLTYHDSPKTATAVSVTGVGITGSESLTYNTVYGEWNEWTSPSTQVFFGTSYPAGLPYTYTFSITDATGTRTATSIVSCFQQQFVTNLSPTGSVTGTPTFSWTGIADASARYQVQLNDSNYNRIWDSQNISGTSIVYSGPAMTPGMTYKYDVVVQSSGACSSGESFAQGSFTYGNGGGTANAPIAQVVNNSGERIDHVNVGNATFTANLSYNTTLYSTDNGSYCGDGCSTAPSTVAEGTNSIVVYPTATSSAVSVGSLGSFSIGNAYAVNIRNVGGYCAELWQMADTSTPFNNNGTRAFIGTTCSGGNFILSVNNDGMGAVTSNTGGINCGSTCSATYSSGASVTLTATPASGSTFAGWSGACTGTGTCALSMTAAKNVTATFHLIPFPVATTGVTAGIITAPVATVTATIAAKAEDVGKTVSVFITAMMPSSAAGTFGVTAQALSSSNTPRTIALAAPAASSLVLMNLTSSGWQPVVNGQLIPYTTGVLSAQLAAITILNNASTASLGGSQFCVGYGTSVTEMNSAGRMQLIASVPDPNAASAATDSCILISDARAFAYAEANFPSIFTGTATAGQATYQGNQYDYRYYPASGNYLGVDPSGMVYLLGPYTGSALTPVGQVESFRSVITAWEAAP